MVKAPSLSPRQAKALALVAQGWTFSEVGSRLRIAPRVVLLYLIHLQRYVGTQTPDELTQALHEARLLPSEWAKTQTRRLRRRAPSPAVSPAAGATPETRPGRAST